MYAYAVGGATLPPALAPATVRAMRRLRSLRDIPLPALAFVLVAAEQTAYAVWRGIAWAPDSDTYQAWADTLLRVHFDVPAFLRVTTSDYPPLLYVVWVSVVAAVRSVLGDDWDVGVVVLNVIASVRLSHALP